MADPRSLSDEELLAQLADSLASDVSEPTAEALTTLRAQVLEQGTTLTDRERRRRSRHLGWRASPAWHGGSGWIPRVWAGALAAGVIAAGTAAGLAVALGGSTAPVVGTVGTVGAVRSAQMVLSADVSHHKAQPAVIARDIRTLTTRLSDLPRPQRPGLGSGPASAIAAACTELRTRNAGAPPPQRIPLPPGCQPKGLPPGVLPPPRPPPGAPPPIPGSGQGSGPGSGPRSGPGQGAPPGQPT